MLTGRIRVHCTICDQWYMSIEADCMGSVQLGFCEPCQISGAAEQEVPDLMPGGPVLGTPAARENPSAERTPTPAAAPCNPTLGIDSDEGTPGVSPLESSPDSKNTDAPGGNPSAAGASLDLAAFARKMMRKPKW